MERARWTDERLDDLSVRMDAGFAQVDRSFERVDRDIRDLRVEMRQGFDGLQTMIWGFGGAMIACLVAAIVAVLVGS